MTGDQEVWLTPADAAWQSGVTTPTLRIWERTKGLVSRRTGRGWREYLEASLSAILALDETGEEEEWPTC